MASLRPPPADLVIAGVLLVLGLVEVWLLGEGRQVVASGGALVMSTALAWRRVAPTAACVTVAATELTVAQLSVPIDSHVFILPVFVLALYSLGNYASARRSLVGVGVTLLLVNLSLFANEGPGAENLGFGAVVVGSPWLAGRLVRRRTDQAVELALHAQELERSQAERERAAVAQERARIARELHDIVAHSVSVMTVQAGGIEQVVDRDPAKAKEAAQSVRQTGRQALTDLRRLLGLLREDGAHGDALAPQPGLADLEALVSQVRRAGLDVHLAIEGPPRALPRGVALSAFRVVQEALTNTLKHAAASRADVAVRYGTDVVDIEVVDDGVGGDGNGGGHGLVGMRERIALYDGSLDYGPRASGGFRVRALLPVGGDVE